MKTLYTLFFSFVFLTTNLYSQFEDERNRYPKLNEGEFSLESSQRITDPEELDSLILSKMEINHIPGLSALIVKHDSIIWSRNFGYANLALNHAVEDTTLFLMASISKTIMITAIMQLWEDGLFNLDDNINDYLQPEFQVINPLFPNDVITFKMLMTHTSSIDDNWTVLNPLIVCGDSPISLDSLLTNYFNPDGIYYDLANFIGWSPNANGFHYTNVGSSILAFLVEKLSGITFDQYCKENIFDPLEMKKSSLFLAGINSEEIATPYRWANNLHYPYCHQGWPVYPVAFLRTNKIELLNFLLTYMHNGTYNGVTLLNSATVDTILTVYIAGYAQGLIWYKTNYGQGGLWGHAGQWLGCATGMYFHPEEGWGFMTFINLDSPSGIWLINSFISEFAHSYIISEVENEITLPVSYKLYQNYPNPFNPSTRIRYSVPQTSNVLVKVFDILGNEIETLVNEEKSTGTYEITWHAEELPSGVYFYRLQAGDFVETKKMILIK